MTSACVSHHAEQHSLVDDREHDPTLCKEQWALEMKARLRLWAVGLSLGAGLHLWVNSATASRLRSR